MMTEDQLIRELESRGYKSEYLDGMVIAAVPSYDKNKDVVTKLIKKLGYERSFGVRPESSKGEEDASPQKGNTKKRNKAHSV